MTNVHYLLAALLAAGFALTTGPAAASNCKMLQIADWPVRPGRGVPIVDGAINGQKIGVMLDTGSSTSLIVRAAAERLGLSRQETRGLRVFGIGGETQAQATIVDEFRIGEVTRKNLRFMVAGERDLGKYLDVILGEDFLDQLDVEFDLGHNSVKLFQPTDCEGVSLAYWATQGASEVAMESFLNAGPRIVVQVQVNGRPMRAQLDSGSHTSVLDKSAAEQLGITSDSPGVVANAKGGGLGAKSVDFWSAPLQSFAIGNETIRDTTIQFADLLKDATYTPTGSHLARRVEGNPVLLGADFLRAHRVLVAHSQRKIYFTYEGGPVFQTTGAPGPRNVPPAAENAKPSTSEK